jgi:hypothetical protein
MIHSPGANTLRILAFALLAVTMGAQTPTIFIGSAIPGSSEVQPKAAHERRMPRAPSIASSTIGYVTGPGPVDIRPILGTLASIHLGDLLLPPNGAARLYLPPKQRYALVEQSSDGAIIVWPLGRAPSVNPKDLVTPISGALHRPNIVAFSPKAESVVLFSRESNRLQLVTGLPFKPSVLRQLSTLNLGELSSIAVTDDASLVLAGFADGTWMFSSDDSRWQPLPAGYTAQAWSFVPNTHDLVISDPTQKLILLLPNGAPGVARVLAEDVRADHLVVTADGELVVAADSTNGDVWTIDLKTGALTPVLSGMTVRSLSSLQLARTFLLSSSPGLSVISLPSAPDGSVLSLRSEGASQSLELQTDH